MQRVYRDALTQAAGQDAELEAIKGRFEGLMQRYLCLKAALSEPSRTEHASLFLTATAVWLTQQAARPAGGTELNSRAPAGEQCQAHQCNPATQSNT